MLRNYFVIALRNLVKSTGLSAIKIVGLAVGVCGCIIVFLLARLELSFDRHHTGGENVYRIYSQFNGVYTGANRGVPLPLPAAFQDRATGIDDVSQIITGNYDVIINEGGNEKKFTKPNYVAFIDSNYFKVFPDYRWIAGGASVLRDPNTVVLTESKAKNYFGDTDLSNVLGKRVIYRDSLEVTVAGIVADIENNTDFNFTDFISFATTQSGWMKKELDFQEWGSISSGWLCMIRVADGSALGNIEELLKTMAKEKDDKEAASGDPLTTFTSFSLQPLSDIHFNTTLGTWNDGRSGASLGTIKALVAIALLLLLVAVINF